MAQLTEPPAPLSVHWRAAAPSPCPRRQLALELWSLEVFRLRRKPLQRILVGGPREAPQILTFPLSKTSPGTCRSYLTQEVDGPDAGMEERRGGARRQCVAAGGLKRHPAGVSSSPHKDADAVLGGGGDSMCDEDKGEETLEPGSRAPGADPRTTMTDGNLRPNTCIICWESCASCGAHRICCIPCGHVYGRFCLERWLIQCGGAAAKCPGCGEQFEHKHILDLYPATEYLWDDCRYEQATKHDAMEGEATEQVVKAAMEEIARKDRLIAQMEEKMSQMTLIQDTMVTLTKLHETEKHIALLERIKLFSFLLMALLLCFLVAILMML